MNNFIEVDSTYRNRNLWPLSGQFEIPIAQTGNKDNKIDAIDPVCLSAPLTVFSPATTIPSLTLVLYSNISVGTVFKLSSLGSLSIVENFYKGLILKILDNVGGFKSLSRITSYNYLGANTVFPVLSYGAFIVDDFITNVINTDGIIVLNPSDFYDLNFPLIFVPNGASQFDAYQNYILYNHQRNSFSNVVSYDSIRKMLQLATIPNTWSLGDTYSIRKQLPFGGFDSLSNKNANVITVLTVDAISGFTPSLVTDYYKNFYILIYARGFLLGSDPYLYTSRILSYVNNAGILTFTVQNNLKLLTNTLPFYVVEILEFSYDNFNPFTYIGTLVQQATCYEFELINLILPNFTLSSGFGSKIAFYPFIYVELTNISSSTVYSKNMLQSNDPNAVKNLFKVPIYDVQDPDSTPFVRLLDCNMIQTIKFKPDDNLFFSVYLPNGDIFNTLLSETYSPQIPNFFSQVSALFRYKRII